MEVFKFGGASVQHAEGLKHVVRVLKKTKYTQLVIVVSAIGKTTNALEQVVKQYLDHHINTATQALAVVEKYHYNILKELSLIKEKRVSRQLNGYFKDLILFLKTNTSQNKDYIYDQVVSVGELLSSTLLHAVLQDAKIKCQWVDIRQVLCTDAKFRAAEVNWKKTEKAMRSQFIQTTQDCTYLTQGFIASTESGHTTTLGREGSDYSAAIIAHALNAKRVTIWKDVPGVLNADPRYFEDTQLLNRISYNEAIELTFYGASVIHPKTLQPLQRKNIPLHVKAFATPGVRGTCIDKRVGIDPQIPCFVLKREEVLLRLSARDFGFVQEEHLEEIFRLLSYYRLKVDLLQNSAIRISLCLEDPLDHLDPLMEQLNDRFKVSITHNVCLYTIRYFDQDAIKQIEQKHSVLLKQVAGNMAQLVVK